ncbi:hypothetical protein F5Y12DRAFT_596202 [Xylaria sp. FL1777]|nr:hypothetical protein F5Y12DRAFT_596202 [Xylaria sp. FL1777]
MSPKVDSKVSVPTRSAWSRDVGPNTSGVTYSRRSYYYDREFSDSIVRPTDDFESFPASGAILRRGGTRGADGGRHVGIEIKVEDPFTRSRILQSAGGDDDESDDDEFPRVLESQSRAFAGAQLNVPAPSPAATTPDPGLTIAGLNLQDIGQGIVIAADIFVRLSEAYQRIRDREASGYEGAEDDEDDDDELFGLDIDPCHLEAGPPRRPRRLSRSSPSPARKNTPRRPRGGAAASGASDGTQGHTDSYSGDATVNATRTRSLLPPLSAAKRVCYYLIATAILGIAASFGIAVWWALSRGDASAGFTIGGYVIAVDALVVAIAGIVHRPGCRCWKP